MPVCSYYDAYYGGSAKIRTLIKRDFESAFELVDAIAAPASDDGFRLGEHTDDPGDALETCSPCTNWRVPGLIPGGFR
jgi:Asp-tRNA(Asn)/Glu-tRNA(Gln) amidotransferase A subunit family amidase